MIKQVYEYAFIFAASTWLGCGNDPQTGGETHWGRSFLAACVSDAQCDSPYQCVDHVCSRPCDASDDCGIEAGSFCDDAGKCIVAARQDCTAAEQPCDATSEGWACDAVDVDACRATVTVCRNGRWLEGVLDDCRSAISETNDDVLVVRRSEVIRPVDVLMVVDNSTSMAREQVALGHAMPAFVATLAARGVGDLRVATTSVDVQCDTTTRPTRGRFNVSPITTASVTSAWTVRTACEEDTDCDALGLGPWVCNSTGTCDTTSNGTPVSACRLTCEVDQDCTNRLGAGHRCLTIGGFSGCVPVDDTCPSTLDPVLSDTALDDVACAFHVGLSQAACLTVEQPLEAMRLALDPSGVNAAQSASFLRTDAVLAVVVMSDEDDCSLVADAPLDLDAFRCSVLGSEATSGPLVPTTHFTEFLRGLKAPGRTFFATIAGDSLASDPAQRDVDRAAWTDAMNSDRECDWQSSICTTTDASGSAQYAGRLLTVTEAMGPDSHAENICGDDMSAAITRIAEQLAETATRICLPTAPVAGFTVTRVIAGVETPVVEGAGAGTWHLANDGAAECTSGIAIVVSDPPIAGESLRFAWP